MKSKTNPSKLTREAAKVRRMAKRLAQSTLMAAAIAASQLPSGEREVSVRLFDQSVVDGLNEPLSRHHE